MKLIAILLGTMLFTAMQGQQLIVMSKPVRAKGLSGVVTDTAGGLIPSAEVRLFTCPADWPHSEEGKTLVTVSSDANGHFAIPANPSATPYCLHFQAPNFQQVVIRVRLSRFAGDLHVELPVGV